MPDGGATLDASGLLSPDAVRRFFHERGDVSLGIVPQLLLDDASADAWGYFWYAARVADDDIEAGRATADAYVARLRDGLDGSPPRRALDRFLAGLQPPWDVDAVRDELARSLRALGRERSLTEAPTLDAYAETVRDKAGVPLTILNRLLLPGADEANLRRFSLLLAFSIQIGDDLRDRARDAAMGLHAFTREELALAERERPGETDLVPLVVQPWREAASQWLAILALERAERFDDPSHRANARIESLLWLRAIELGQLRDTRRPLRWPAPLGDLLREGPPSAARMAAARRVLHTEPKVLGEAQRWDPRARMEGLQRLRTQFPELYSVFEVAARA